MKKMWFANLVLTILSITFLVACSNKDEGRSEIPVFSKLVSAGNKFETARQKMVVIEKTALPDKQIEISAYTTNSNMDEVQQFYDNNLKGWKDLGSSDQNGITIVRWGTGKTKGFALYYSKDPGGSNNIVLLEQFWK